MEVRNEIVIRRGDIANALLAKGYKIIKLKKDKKYHYSSNFVFENTPGFLEDFNEILNRYHLEDDDPDIHYKKTGTDDSSRGGYSKTTIVNLSDIDRS